MTNLIKISFFPSYYFNDLEKNNIDDIYKNKEKIKQEILKTNSLSFLYELYEKEKIEIKNQNYKLISSIINYNNQILNILKKYSIISALQIDFILNNKTNIFVDSNFNNRELIFILKSFTIFEFLSVKSLSSYNFYIYELKKNKNYIENKLKLNKLKQEIYKLNLECDVFLLSDGFFSLDEKKINYLLMKTDFFE